MNIYVDILNIFIYFSLIFSLQIYRQSPLVGQLQQIDEDTSNSQSNYNIQEQQEQQQEQDFKLLSYKPYFDKHLYVQNDNEEQFSYYIKNEQFTDYPIICIHGAGFSALSYCQLAYLMKNDSCIISIDLRGHGFSTKNPPYSFDQFTTDLNQVIIKILDKHAVKKLDKYNIVLIGHSFGGSIICGISNPRLEVQCLCPIDIAEHIAIRSLKNMDIVVQTLNKKYQSYNQVIQNYQRSKILVNEKAIKLQLDGIIDEDTMMPRFKFYDSEIYWKNWFSNFNNRFLQSKGYKFLVVSNYQHLDPEQEIAYSQGILGLEIINTNHNIHEEKPVEYAYALQRFLRRLHLTQQTYNQNMDYDQPLQSWELPESKETLNNMLNEAWQQCNQIDI